jgi:hypothetical protein
MCRDPEVMQSPVGCPWVYIVATELGQLCRYIGRCWAECRTICVTRWPQVDNELRVNFDHELQKQRNYPEKVKYRTLATSRKSS